MADDGLPLAESKRRLYRRFVELLEGGRYLAGRSTPSLPDFAAYPQFALFWATGFRGSEDILAHPEIMAWLGRMKPHVTGAPPLVPEVVRERELPA